MTSTDALELDLQTAYTARLVRIRRRRRLARTAAAASAGALVLAGAGLGAAALLGWPAPVHVKNEIAAVDRGLPADLRLNPDVEHAQAVASTETATLYAASLHDGGSCTEIVTAGDRGRGATCTTGAELASRALDVTLPTDVGDGPESSVVIGGRINAAAGASLEARYSDGSSEEIPLGEDRYFLFEVPAEHRASVRASGVELVARDGDGSVVGRTSIPADWDDPPVPDEKAPLYVSTRSDESDFTKVYGLEGHVGAAGAATLELDYGDESTPISIPISADGSYAYTLPADRTDDFMQPRTLVARDAAGQVVASAPVAAVAYWRGRERGAP
jgi:hypothetical protein